MENELRRVLSAEEYDRIKEMSELHKRSVLDIGIERLSAFRQGGSWYCGYAECAQQSAPLTLVVELCEAFERVCNNWECGELNADVHGDFTNARQALTKAQQFMPKTGEDA